MSSISISSGDGSSRSSRRPDSMRCQARGPPSRAPAFILVPGFVVFGVVLAVLQGRERERLLGLRGICPRCGREKEFGPGDRQGGQTWVTCPGCFNRVAVTIGALDPARTHAASEPLKPAGTPR